MRIRAPNPADLSTIAEIYNHYILSTTITFDETEVTPADMAERVQEVASSSFPWLVAEESGQVVGFAYASKWKGRCAYRHSAETTVCVTPTAVDRSIGTALYEALFGVLRQSVHAIIGGIALPNPASIALHERFGMRKVAHFEQVGFKFGKWIDVGYWELVTAPT